MHRLLLRQLRRTGLTIDAPPHPDSKKWQTFLSHINRSYQEADQDRYTLEHSLQISSEEMQSLVEAVGEASAHQLEREQARLRSLIDSIPDLIVFKDAEQRCLGCNQAFATFIGRTEEELIGSDDCQLPPSRPQPELLPGERRSPASSRRGEQWIAHPDGSEVLFETIDTPFCNSRHEVLGTIQISHDITERKRSEDRLAFQARHDSLTGLPNRLRLDELLIQAIETAQRLHTVFALLFLDLDRFKNINDTLGHPAGDHVLQGMGRRLREQLRDSDIISRLGGDEFVVLLRDIGPPDQAARVAAKMVAAMSRPLSWQGHQLSLSISIGLSLYPEHGRDAMTLMKHADTAMYMAKEQGGNGYQFYTPELTDRTQRFLDREGALRQALRNDEFLLHYQAKVDPSSGVLKGAEALVRWNHPQQGLIGPQQFLPLAEETGLIIPIGEWVLRNACSQLHQWMNEGLPIAEISVNLWTPQLLNEQLIPMVARVLSQTGIAAKSLTLEVAETAVMTHADRSVQVLKSLKGLGVSLAIDNFGTGYSSMSYLNHLPIDEIKIDRSFISNLPQDRDSVEITRAIIALARSLRLEVVAVGVETLEQQLFLALQQCHKAQGYLYNAPAGSKRFQGFF